MGEPDKFTRRSVLGGAAAAGAMVALPAGLARAAGRPSPRRVSTRLLGALRGESSPIRSPSGFALAGIQWDAPARARIELRARSGSWSPWVPASTAGHDPDGPRRPTAHFGEPVWTGPADAVQLRSEQPVHGVRIHFVAAPATAEAGAGSSLPLAQPVLDAGPGQPPIIARRGWARGHHPTGLIVGYGSVKLAFVHHTVNANGYAEWEVPGILRAIFDYHRYVRGFFDIAYNFLIDAYGRVWEGRAGGIDMAVIGAHAGAYNAESTGVAVLGDFMDVVPRPAAMDALRHLLAWKLSLHGVPALGRATVVVDPSDAFYTPFAPGQHVSLPHIAGHRDGDLTDCPGDALYRRLPALRPKVAALAAVNGAPARLTTIVGPAALVAGGEASFSGTLTLLDGTPVTGAPIELQQLNFNHSRTAAAAPTIAYLETGADGSWSASMTPPENLTLRALHRPAPAAVADWATVAVAPALALSLISAAPLQVSGTVSPAKPGVIVELYRAARPHQPIARRRVSAGTGSFSAGFGTRRPGSYLVLARTDADALNAAGASSPVAVTIS